MTRSALPAAAVVALLVLAGCTGPVGPGSGEPTPTPEDFPAAAEIDASVFDEHAATMANTSFTLAVESTKKEHNPDFIEENFSYINSTARNLVDPSASRYLAHVDGYFTGNATAYSNGSTMGYIRGWNPETEELKIGETRLPVFDESGDRYLWSGWFGNHTVGAYPPIVVNATWERERIESYRGVPVMRYEASGVDALPDWLTDANDREFYEGFTATLLLDEEGVIRHFSFEIHFGPDSQNERLTESYNLSDVGSTEVERPAWVQNATVDG